MVALSGSGHIRQRSPGMFETAEQDFLHNAQRSAIPYSLLTYISQKPVMDPAFKVHPQN
jgi:hypothetical protein